VVVAGAAAVVVGAAGAMVVGAAATVDVGAVVGAPALALLQPARARAVTTTSAPGIHRARGLISPL